MLVTGGRTGPLPVAEPLHLFGPCRAEGPLCQNQNTLLNKFFCEFGPFPRNSGQKLLTFILRCGYRYLIPSEGCSPKAKSWAGTDPGRAGSVSSTLAMVVR